MIPEENGEAYETTCEIEINAGSGNPPQCDGFARSDLWKNGVAGGGNFWIGRAWFLHHTPPTGAGIGSDSFTTGHF